MLSEDEKSRFGEKRSLLPAEITQIPASGSRVMDVAANMTKARGQRGIKETSVKKYEVELREKFNQVIGSTPEWADLNYKPKEDSDDNDEMMRSTGNYLSGKSSFALPKMSLEFKQMNDLNSSHTEGAFIQAIEFNPHLQVGLVAGSSRHLGAASLFQVDGKANHRIQSVRFPSYPISCARFIRDGKKFVVGSNMYNHIFVYDMETSKETKIFVNKKFEKGVKKNLYVCPDGELLIFLGSRGKIYIYDAATFSLIDTMEAPHPLTSATFNADGSRMYSHGLTGEVCVWDMHARECVHKFYDEGCIAGEAIAMSPNNQYLACGSRSGIVNVYDSASISTNSPTPVKVLSNLTTSVTALTFNASSEVLAMASNHLPNALKLVHFPSMTIFENFPKQGNVAKRSEVLQFSPQSGYFAVGNYTGTAALYRLKHFSSY